ncbi:P-loop NTPase fold protein [Rhizobium ruizarguesonis]|uniref:P-loop NTPase fold protein n=1 Tax=Rhizobium ruizarguesonis TaxID=2081791 RepID=UPI0013EEC98F|nr:P-loop NTPase fold protein [Rhizobium ruizarguesonis]
MESKDLSAATSQGVRTRQSAVAPAISPYWVLLLALAGLVLVLYGFLWQPARQDPFAKPVNWIDWFLHPLPATEINGLGQRPLGSPGAGWAPRALGETQAAWIGEDTLQLRPEGRYPTLAMWSDGTGAIVGADGRIYLHDQPPLEPVRIDRRPILILEFKAHAGKVASAAFSPDGARIVTASADGTARTWNAATGNRLNELSGHTGVVTSAAFSPDGRRIVTASEDGTARIWDAATGSELMVLRGHEGAVMSAVFSPDGSLVATGSLDDTARIWDAATGEQLHVLNGHSAVVFSVAFSPDGKRIVTGSADRTTRVWDVATARQIVSRSDHEEPVDSAMFSPDGRSIVTASVDRTVRIWNDDGAENTDILSGYTDTVYIAAFSPNGRNIVTASADGTARVWVTVAGKQRDVVELPGAAANSAAFSPDGGRIVTASGDGTIRVYSVMQGSVPSAGVRLPDEAVCWTASEASWSCSSDLTFSSVLLSLRMDEHSGGGPLAPSVGPGRPAGMVDEKGQQIQQQQVQQQRQQQQQQQQQLTQQQELNPQPPAQLGLPVDLPASATFRALAFLDATTLFVVGGDGLIMVAEQLTPGAATFRQLRLIPGETLTGIRFDDDKAAWVAGERRRQQPFAIWPFTGLTGNTPVTETFVLYARHPLADPWQELKSFPAPWTFAAAPVVFLMLGYAGVAFARGVAVERQGIENAPASDSPIGWRDRDALKLKPIALAMSRFIRNIDTRPPLTIAVTGGWGSGKSSLMNLLREDLRRYGARPVWFNAWHHREEVSLLAALLEAVRSTVVPHWYTWSGMVFRTRLLALRLRGPLQSALAACVLLLITLFVADMGLQGRLGSALTDIVTSGAAESASAEKVASPQADGKATDADGAEAAQATAKDTPNSLEHWLEKSLSWLGLDPKTGIGAILAFAALLFVRSKLIAFPVEPAKLLSQLRNRASVTDYRDKLSFRSQFASAFGDVCRTARTSRNPGIIIIIDDLDRCPADAVLAVLEAVNYLVSAGSCFVVLGIDRKQIEHAVGLGFKDIVDGMPDRELGVAALPPADPADPAVRVTARRRAFARRYLEKLINIETAVPPLQPEAAVSMLVDEGPEPGADPRWLAPFKSTASFILDFCRTAAIAALIGGCAALLLQPFATRQIGEPASPSTVSRLGIGTVAAPTPANDGTGQPNLAPAPAEKPFRFEPAPWHTERELIPRLAWVIGDVLLVIFLLVFLLVDLARRRMDIEKDSDAFADTLRKVTPFVHAVNPTPRAVKLFENRMRYLAARLDAEANPRRPDILDRIVRRLLPADWFDRKPPALDETKLLILGAEEISGDEIKLSRDFLSAVTADDRRAYTSIVGAASPETRS